MSRSGTAEVECNAISINKASTDADATDGNNSPLSGSLVGGEMIKLTFASFGTKYFFEK